MDNETYDKIIDKLKSGNDIWFIRTKKSRELHISINNETYCSNVAKNVYYISQKSPPYNQHRFNIGENEDRDLFMCHTCLYCSQHNYNRKYVVLWRCNFTTALKKRCSKNSNSPYNTFCVQHLNLVVKRLNKYFSNDVSKIIVKLL